MLINIDDNLIDDALEVSNEKVNKETDEGKEEIESLLQEIISDWIARKEYLAG